MLSSSIVEETGLSKGTVKDCITKLHKAGYININSGYFGCSNNYYFPKEWFYDLFADDIKQIMARRKTGSKSALKVDRETKKDKTIKEQNKEIAELKKELAKLKGAKEVKTKPNWGPTTFTATIEGVDSPQWTITLAPQGIPSNNYTSSIDNGAGTFTVECKYLYNGKYLKYTISEATTGKTLDYNVLLAAML